MNESESPANLEAMRRQLIDVGQGLEGQCSELYRAPTPDKCERLAVNLEGARRYILLLGEALRREPRE